jgi:hypothetical protein
MPLHRPYMMWANMPYEHAMIPIGPPGATIAGSKTGMTTGMTENYLSASMTRATSRRGLLEPDNRPNVVKKLEFHAAQYAAFGGRRMDITTLLIIVVLIMLLGGGGWYGRGRWY